MATNIDKFTDTTEVAALAGVPIGGVIMWMNPGAAALNPPPPTGFEFCDGTAVITAGSPLLGEAKPNLMITSAGGALGMVRGADVNGATYGVGTPLISGGTDSHTHGAGVGSGGAHDHSMQGHTHTGGSHSHVISSDGAHQHQTNMPGNVPYEVFAGGGSNYNINSAGAHSHGGSTLTNSATTGSPSTANTSSVGGHGHSISADTNVPFNTALAFIVRVV